MHALSRRFAVLPLLVSLLFPTGSFAAASTVSDLLGATGNREVTRAEFLKAGVVALGLDVDLGAPPKQYRAYPEAVRAYVRTADEAGAFDAFGAKPDLAKPVTRGEAVRLVAELRAWDGTGGITTARLGGSFHLAKAEPHGRAFSRRGGFER